METPNTSGHSHVDDDDPRPSSTDSSTINGGDIGSMKAETFLQKRGATIHPIFAAENPSLEQQNTGLTENTPHQSIDQHTQQFLQVMETYQASMNDSTVSVLDLRGKHSWDEVLQVARDAEAVYLQAGKRGLRKVGRIIASKSEAALPLVRLIPNENYLSVLCGGLKIVFEAASRISEKREQILKALLRIPGVITQAQHSRENFPADTALYERASDLYLAALTAIEGTTKWLLKSPSWKHARSMMLGGLYNKSFKEKLQALDEAVGKLQDRVSTLRDTAIISARRTVEGVETAVEKIEKTGEVVNTTTKATLQHVESTDLKVTSITEDLETMAKSQDETHVKIDHLNDLRQVKAEANRAMMMVLEETTKTSEWMREKDRDIRRLQRQIDILEQAAIALTPEDLLEILGVSAVSSEQDFRRVIRLKQSSQLSASYIAKGVFEGPKFQKWQSKDVSTTLFIEGSGPSVHHSRSSPVTHISSSVIEHLQDREPAVAIYFFCGLHTLPQDPVCGPHGMMSSLICQILRKFSMKLDFVSRRYREQLEALSFDILLDIFEKLVRRLPMTTVLFCVIDSVSFFERREWVENCRRAIIHLRELADDEKLGPIVKLLITNPSRSRCMGDIMPARSRLSLPMDDADGRDGPTGRQLSLGARRPPGRVRMSNVSQLSRMRTYSSREDEDLTGSVIESDDSSFASNR